MSDVSQIQIGNGQNVNKPSSGTYGEKAANNRLKQSLPAAPGGPTGQPTAPATQPNLPVPPPQAQRPTPKGILPDVLTAPTNRPDESVNTPFSGGAGAMQPPQTAQQLQLAILDTLRSAPGVSDRTREFAETLFQLYMEIGRQ